MVLSSAALVVVFLCARGKMIRVRNLLSEIPLLKENSCELVFSVLVHRQLVSTEEERLPSLYICIICFLCSFNPRPNLQVRFLNH